MSIDIGSFLLGLTIGVAAMSGISLMAVWPTIQRRRNKRP